MIKKLMLVAVMGLVGLASPKASANWDVHWGVFGSTTGNFQIGIRDHATNVVIRSQNPPIGANCYTEWFYLLNDLHDTGPNGSACNTIMKKQYDIVFKAPGAPETAWFMLKSFQLGPEVVWRFCSRDFCNFPDNQCSGVGPQEDILPPCLD